MFQVLNITVGHLIMTNQQPEKIEWPVKRPPCFQLTEIKAVAENKTIWISFTACFPSLSLDKLLQLLGTT